MYIIAIAWIYVTILVAATEPNPVAGILSFLFYGLLPLALFLWLFGAPARRRRRLAGETVHNGMDRRDGRDSQSDQ